MKSPKLLVERIANIERHDVDMLYAPLSKIVDKVSQTFARYTKEEDLSKALLDIAGPYLNYRDDKPAELLKEFSSADLKSGVCRVANKIKPIKIEIYTMVPNNMYCAEDSLLGMGMPAGSIKSLALYDELSDTDKRVIKTEFTSIRVRSTIVHELAHWIDDAMHNLHLTRHGDNLASYIKGANPVATLGTAEINSVVYQIAQIKKDIGDSAYNNLNFNELCELHPHLLKLNSSQHSKEWRKLVLSRMSREGLLTPKMR